MKSNFWVDELVGTTGNVACSVHSTHRRRSCSWASRPEDKDSSLQRHRLRCLQNSTCYRPSHPPTSGRWPFHKWNLLLLEQIALQSLDITIATYIQRGKLLSAFSYTSWSGLDVPEIVMFSKTQHYWILTRILTDLTVTHKDQECHPKQRPGHCLHVFRLNHSTFPQGMNYSLPFWKTRP